MQFEVEGDHSTAEYGTRCGNEAEQPRRLVVAEGKGSRLGPDLGLTAAFTQRVFEVSAVEGECEHDPLCALHGCGRITSHRRQSRLRTGEDASGDEGGAEATDSLRPLRDLCSVAAHDTARVPRAINESLLVQTGAIRMREVEKEALTTEEDSRTARHRTRRGGEGHRGRTIVEEWHRRVAKIARGAVEAEGDVDPAALDGRIGIGGCDAEYAFGTHLEHLAFVAAKSAACDKRAGRGAFRGAKSIEALAVHGDDGASRSWPCPRFER